MVIKSLSFERDAYITPKLICDIWNEIYRLRNYFYHFSGDNSDEMMQRTLYHAVTHYDPSGNLQSYLKRLARDIKKVDLTKEIPTDITEATFQNKLEQDENTKQSEPRGTIVNNTKDFSDDLLDRLEMEEESHNDINLLAVTYPKEFITLCEALETQTINSTGYSNEFTLECLKYSKKYKADFNNICLEIYDTMKEAFYVFLQNPIKTTERDIEILWQPLNATLLGKHISKRLVFKNKVTDELVEDADTEQFYLAGTKIKGTGKRILKINYADLWDIFCNKIESTVSNELKLVVGEYYLVKTLGGIVSDVNQDLLNVYRALKEEIIMNIVYDTYGRVINVGSANVYLLWDSSIQTIYSYNLKGLKKVNNKVYIHKNINDFEFDLVVEDITDKCIQ